jgi:hypothetical protein
MSASASHHLAPAVRRIDAPVDAVVMAATDPDTLLGSADHHHDGLADAMQHAVAA